LGKRTSDAEDESTASAEDDAAAEAEDAAISEAAIASGRRILATEEKDIGDD
jgi:hypothetical protein